MYLVGIGTPERSLQFAEMTQFPTELLLADPENATYDALEFKKGIKETFFSVETPLAMWDRIKTGRTGDLKTVLGKWTQQGIWNPPRKDQAFQQGGAVVFQGRRLLFAHYDKATSAHVDLQLLLAEASRGL